MNQTITQTQNSADQNSLHFCTEHVKKDLARRSLGGGGLTLASQALRVVLQLATAIMLARILGPSSYGIYGIILAVTSFGSVFRDMGLSLAVVQTNEIDQNQMSTLFWLNLLQSLGLAAATVLCAPLIAAFYNQPLLTPLLVASSLLYPLYALGNLHQALLRRQMRFGALCAIELLSGIFAAGIAAFAAFHGAGVWSLVSIQLSAALVGTVGGLSFCRWRAGRPTRGCEIKSLLRFGAHATGFNFLGYLNRNVDDLLIGRFCGMSMLGLYDRAYEIYMLPTLNISWPMAGVGITSLSRVRSNSADLNHYARTAMLLVAGVCMPVIAFSFVKVDSIVQLTIGPQWAQTALFFRALAPAGFLEPLIIVGAWPFIALGLTGRVLRCRVAQAVVTLLIFAAGLRWGALGVALGLSISRLIVPIPTLIYSARGTDFKWAPFAASAIIPAAASFVSAVTVFFFEQLIKGQNQYAQLFLDLGVFVIVYAAIWLAFPSTRDTVRQALGMISKRGAQN